MIAADAHAAEDVALASAETTRDFNTLLGVLGEARRRAVVAPSAEARGNAAHAADALGLAQPATLGPRAPLHDDGQVGSGAGDQHTFTGRHENESLAEARAEERRARVALLSIRAVHPPTAPAPTWVGPVAPAPPSESTSPAGVVRRPVQGSSGAGVAHGNLAFDTTTITTIATDTDDRDDPEGTEAREFASAISALGDTLGHDGHVGDIGETSRKIVRAALAPGSGGGDFAGAAQRTPRAMANTDDQAVAARAQVVLVASSDDVGTPRDMYLEVTGAGSDVDNTDDGTAMPTRRSGAGERALQARGSNLACR